jgi:rhodanese-related sulfurtransferase
MVKNITFKEFRGMFKNNKDELEIIDVREKDEHELIRIKGSKLIPLDDIEARINEIDWSKIVVFCLQKWIKK